MKIQDFQKLVAIIFKIRFRQNQISKMIIKKAKPSAWHVSFFAVRASPSLGTLTQDYFFKENHPLMTAIIDHSGNHIG